jgi:TRAP-type uncharacterized transport system fused permease subunit
VSLITAKIAGAPYIKTAKESCKAALAGFLIPYIFVYCPVLLLEPIEPFFAIVAILISFMLLISFEAALVGFFISDCSWAERGGFFLSAGLGFTALVHRSFVVAAVSAAAFVVMVMWHRLKVTGAYEAEVGRSV